MDSESPNSESPKRKADHSREILKNTVDVYDVLKDAGLQESVLPSNVLSELENQGLTDKPEEYKGDKYQLPPKAYKSKAKKNHERLVKAVTKKISSVHAKTLFEQMADKHIDVVKADGSEVKPEQFVTREKRSYDIENGKHEYIGGKITRDIWIPYRDNNVLELEAEFVKWIDSMFPRGFSHAIENTKFNIYIQQAEDWYSAGYDITNCNNVKEQVQFCLEEKRRFEENSLYYAFKYGRLKDGSFDGGRRRIEPYRAQIFLLYLFDCGLSAIIGKMRQLGITSILGIGAAAKTMYRREFFTKYICEDDSKTRSVFEDKIKYPISETPQYLVPSSFSDQERQLKFGVKEVKGRTGGANSKIEVVPPSPTAVNSGSPQLVMIDEIGNIPVLTKMVNEARPTMFVYNPISKKIEMRRQLFMWGTGGEMKTESFETEMTAALENWKKRNFKYGIIPVFLDAYCKPGVEGEFYESEKRNAYSKTGADRNTSISQFHAAYPTHIEDMFIRNVETLIPIADCNNHLERIYALKPEEQAIWGRFDPVFDTNRPTPESDLPYAVVAVTFVPMSEDDDPPVRLMLEPNRKWKYRYFQGTDPINTETGHSRFASAIWDAHYCTVACQVNFRVRDYQECYRQSLYMGLYYDTSGEFVGVPELVEANIGTDYIKYRERKGFDKNMILNKELNPMMHINGATVGISNKTNTRPRIIGNMKRMYEEYGDNIWMEEAFYQLKTFVEKPTATGVKWVASDLKRHYDDVLFSQTYSKMASDLYVEMRRYPLDTETVSKVRVRTRLVRDANGALRKEKVLY